MFGIGFWETIVIILVIILVVKPENIPRFVHKVGRFIGEIKKSYDILLDTFRELEETVKKPVEYIEMEDVYKKNKRKSKSKTSKKSTTVKNVNKSRAVKNKNPKNIKNTKKRGKKI